jgi:hypothetical protein
MLMCDIRLKSLSVCRSPSEAEGEAEGPAEYSEALSHAFSAS